MDFDRLLRYMNPWWDGARDAVLPGSPVRRALFDALVTSLDTPFVDVVVGIRRVGKTVLLHQLVAHLLERGVDPRHILVFQFEETAARVSVEDVVERYFDLVVGATPATAPARTYIFLDEIQVQPDWPAHVKRYRDLNPAGVKFVVSGSHAHLIRSDSRESLAGRIAEHRLDPFCYPEYLALRGESVTPVDLDRLLSDDGPAVLDRLRFDASTSTARHSDRYLRYACCGQFPEVARAEPREAFTYLNERVTERVLRMDLPSRFADAIAKPRSLQDLYALLAEESGGLLEVANLAGEAGINQRTLTKYLDVLAEGFLVRLVPNHQRSARVTFRSAHKCYLGTSNLFAAHHHLEPGAVANPLLAGVLLEVAVLDALSARPGHAVSFWREGRYEVDFVLEAHAEGRLIPIEVKSGRRARSDDVHGLAAFFRRFGPKATAGVLITRDTFDLRRVEGRPVYVLPAWTLG